MNTVSRREVIAAYARTLNALRMYLADAEPRVLEQLIGHEPALRELAAAFERATAPQRCDHVRGPHGTPSEATCVLAAGHQGPHRFSNDNDSNATKENDR